MNQIYRQFKCKQKTLTNIIIFAFFNNLFLTSTNLRSAFVYLHPRRVCREIPPKDRAYVLFFYWLSIDDQHGQFDNAISKNVIRPSP